MIVQELYKIQDRRGFLPRDELEGLARRLATPLYRIQEVVSFFPHFRTAPTPAVEVHVCQDMACRLRGSKRMLTQLQADVASLSQAVTVCGVSCLGRCDRAPVVRLAGTRSDQHTEPTSHESCNYFGRSAAEIAAAIHAVLSGNSPPPSDHDRDVPDVSERWRINIYAGQPVEKRYASIRDFIESAPDDAARDADRRRILQCLRTANLLGMGGAGGRTYKKWEDVQNAKGDKKYVVCNADESEPGTFKDRELLLRTPHLVLEGVILAGLFLNAERGYIYFRHEYEEQIDLMREEIKRAEALGVCGEDLLGSGMSFPVEVFVSPGGYICGEQTALIQAMQDERAEPRNRPPDLQTNGLWDMPTLLNNVETFGWVPAVVQGDEGAWFAQQAAKPEFTGARFFSVSGDVVRPSAVEVPIGITIRGLIERCGGMRDGRPLKAIALSGPSGGFLPRYLPLEDFPAEMTKRVAPGATKVDLLDLELDIALFRKWKLMMGAGIVIYNDAADLIEQADACLHFYERESCGKCLPCRIGSKRMAEWGERLSSRQFTLTELESINRRDGPLQDLAATMRSTAICGLGTVASNPLTSLLAHFPEDIARHLGK